MNVPYTDDAGSTASFLVTNWHEVMYRLKQSLKSAGWVVQASSDGTTFSNTPGNENDVITSAAGLSAVNSWFTIRQPRYTTGVGAPGGRVMGVRRMALSTTFEIFYYPCDVSGNSPSPSAPGTATALPTYAKTGAVFPSATLGDTNPLRWSIGADHEAPYGFWVFGLTSGSSSFYATTAILLDFFAKGSYPAENSDPSLWYFNNATTSWGSHTTSQGATNAPRSYVRLNQSDETFIRMPAARPMTFLTSAIVEREGVGATGFSPHDGKHVLYPVHFQNGMQTQTNNPTTFQGTAHYLRMVGAALAPGFTLTLRSTRDRIVVGDFVFPWNGSVPTYS